MRIERLKSFPGHLLRRAQQNITAIFAEAMADVDLTSVQFLALVAIDDLSGMDATRLAETIGADRATTGGVIERLERKKLIERSGAEADKRIKLLAVTPAGKAIIENCFARIEQVQMRFMAPLSSAEQAQFMALLAKLTKV